jgi:dTDP-4-dehydrorhamnose reductase
MISVLITGAKGQLGRAISRAAKAYPDWTIHYTDIEELDIANQDAVEDFLDQHPVEFIVNCAAYTGVDRAEDDADKAMLLNAGAVDVLARLSGKRNIQLIHLSTDYVFNGENNQPYKEDDPADPKTVYGRTKLAGEEVLQKAGQGIIIRTAWLYSVFGNNFVKTILRLSREKDKLTVVFDQTGSPTNAKDLAAAILEVISQDKQQGRQPRYEVYHYANAGICSWFDFASEILRLAGSGCPVEPVGTVDYPTPAARPRYSVMDTTKIIRDYGITIPHWKDSLKDCIKELNK